MSTHFPKQGETKNEWYIIDLKGQVLGRVASRLATVLRGKHKVDFTPNVECGDFIVAINAKDLVIKGDMDEKFYAKHTGFPSGLKKRTQRQVMEKNPEKILKLTLQGMLPKTLTGRNALKRLRVYPDANHPHEAQKPVELKV